MSKEQANNAAPAEATPETPKAETPMAERLAQYKGLERKIKFGTERKEARKAIDEGRVDKKFLKQSTERGREIIKSLKERVSETGFLGNIVDRVSVWKGSAVKDFYEGWKDSRVALAKKHEGRKEELLEGGFTSSQDIENFKNMGFPVSEKMIQKAEREAQKLGDKAEKQGKKEYGYRMKEAEIQEKLDGYEKKIDAAKARIAERIGKKGDRYEAARLKLETEKINPLKEKVETVYEELDSLEEKLEQAMGEVHPAVRKLQKDTIKRIRGAMKKKAKIIKKMERQVAKLGVKEAKIAGKRDIMEEKRRGVLGIDVEQTTTETESSQKPEQQTERKPFAEKNAEEVMKVIEELIIGAQGDKRLIDVEYLFYMKELTQRPDVQKEMLTELVSMTEKCIENGLMVPETLEKVNSIVDAKLKEQQ